MWKKKKIRVRDTNKAQLYKQKKRPTSGVVAIAVTQPLCPTRTPRAMRCSVILVEGRKRGK